MMLKTSKKILALLLAVLMMMNVCVFQGSAAEDWRKWAQSDSRWSGIWLGGSSGGSVGSIGCLVTAVTKLIIQCNLKSADSFNVATFANAMKSNGGFTDGGAMYWGAPSKVVSGFNYVGVKNQSGSSSSLQSTIVNYVKNGNHVILAVNSYGHYIAVDSVKTLQTGQVYIMDSLSNTSTNADILLTSRYGTVNNIYLYSGGKVNATHTHNYNTYVFYWDVHPHFKCYKCSCGDIKENRNECVFLSNCEYCTPQRGPVTIQSGELFKIQTAAKAGVYLDIDNSKGDNVLGANLQLWTNKKDSPNQIFKIVSLNNGWYKIIAMHSGQALDVVGANPASGTNVQQYTDKGNDAQSFRFIDAGDGYVYIQNKLGCYLLAHGDKSNGCNVAMCTYFGDIVEKWKLEHVHTLNSSVTKIATCSSEGTITYKCKFCSYSKTESISKNPSNHTDSNGDGYCDMCKTELTPHTPSTPDQKNCKCICHKTNGFSKFIYRIVLVFWDLFGIKQVCDCGEYHYKSPTD